MSYLLTQAIALLEEAASYTSCETWSPSLTDEINSFVVNARAALAATPAAPQELQTRLLKMHYCAMKLRDSSAAESDDEGYANRLLRSIEHLQNTIGAATPAAPQPLWSEVRCARCGVDRMKSACGLGSSPTAGEYPMVGIGKGKESDK